MSKAKKKTFSLESIIHQRLRTYFVGKFPDSTKSLFSNIIVGLSTTSNTRI